MNSDLGARLPGKPRVVTIGEALVAALPIEAVTLDVAPALQLHVGGAEVNFAVGIRRLGFEASWIGRLGGDSLGRLVLRELEREGVDCSHVIFDSRQTGLYLREWLPDGVRRPYYYRQGSPGSGLSASDLDLAGLPIRWLHLTGITPALGEQPRFAVEAALGAAADLGVSVSFDANYRPALWSERAFRGFLLPLLPKIEVLLLGEEEAELLLGTRCPEIALDRATELGVRLPVVRLGERGAIARDEMGQYVVQSSPAQALDPVGAGDAFSAGFIAGLLSRASISGCLRLGTYCGARTVEMVGEHEGIPRRHELAEELLDLLGCPESDKPE